MSLHSYSTHTRLSHSSSSSFSSYLIVVLLCVWCSVSLASISPQNHRLVSHDGVCTAANFPATDFCASTVTYPISSRLLHASFTTVSPRHNKAHAEIIRENRLEVLSQKAAAHFDLYMNHHLDSHSQQARRNGIFSVLDDDHSKCEDLLQKYLCQNQFPRCFDDVSYVSHPIQLTTCYSLCHQVRDACHLSHRIDCKTHHAVLNNEWIAPTDHELRFDEKYHTPWAYDEFYQVDCIDSPPSTYKYIYHYLLYGGPGKVSAYTIAALLVYAILSKLFGFGKETTTSVVARLRTIRKAKRIVFENKMRKQQKKYIKLQEIKTVLIDQQTAEQESLDHSSSASSSSPQQLHEIQSSIRDRAAKLQQLDELLSALEEEIQLDVLKMQATIEEEQKENEELGFMGESGEAALAQVEAELSEQEEDGVQITGGRDAEEENEAAAEESIKYFGQRRRPVKPLTHH